MHTQALGRCLCFISPIWMITWYKDSQTPCFLFPLYPAYVVNHSMLQRLVLPHCFQCCIEFHYMMYYNLFYHFLIDEYLSFFYSLAAMEMPQLIVYYTVFRHMCKYICGIKALQQNGWDKHILNFNTYWQIL